MSPSLTKKAFRAASPSTLKEFGGFENMKKDSSPSNP